MYTDATICTKTKNGYSQSIPVKKGVHQGNTLSPTLFNIFVNDITSDMPDHDSPNINIHTNKRISCLMYADDLVLLSKTKVGLQKKLDYLSKYCTQWGLKINAEKTQIIVFCRIKPKMNTLFKCGNDIIKITDQYKYLGIILNQTGNFSTAQKHLSKQGNKASHCLRKTFRNTNIQMDTTLHLFDSLVNPILTYGADVWFPYMFTNKKKINNIGAFFQKCISNECPHELIHIQFCRFLLGVHKKAMWIPVLGELGRFPLSLRMLSQTISYWINILKSGNDSYLYQTYDSMLHHSTENSWIQFIQQSLCGLGFSHVWQNQTTLNVHKLQHAIQEKLQNEYVTFWTKTKLEGRSRLKFYSTMNNKYELQPYLVEITNMKQRNTLSKLRTSTHSLKIEIGRHNNTPKENRLCNTCNEIEDECHFLDNCQKFNDLRNKFKIDVSKINSNFSNKTPSELFTECDIQILLGKYVSDCFERHNQN